MINRETADVAWCLVRCAVILCRDTVEALFLHHNRIGLSAHEPRQHVWQDRALLHSSLTRVCLFSLEQVQNLSQWRLPADGTLR